jgi:hypothetical protein
MRLSHALWAVLGVLATADVHAAPTIADCATPAASGVVQASSDCARLEALSAGHDRPVRSELPDPRALDSILGELGQVEQPMSLWQRFNDWLGDRLRELWDAVPDIPNPLGDLNLNWADWLPGLFRWTGGILLAVVALVALVALLHALGIRSPAVLQRAMDALRPEESGDPEPGAPSWADLEAAPAAHRPRILLAMVIGALRAADRLRADAALSHRQLGAAVRDVTTGQRVAIESIAGLAERVTYSHFVPDNAELAHAATVTQELVGGVSR